MGYVHGSTKKSPLAVLNTFEARINQARNHLLGLERQIAHSKSEAVRVRHIALRARLKNATTYQPMTPEQFRAEAERSYAYAMKVHPENATEGKRRLAEVMDEAYKIHQEAA